jgi:hypothetical protein
MQLQRLIGHIEADIGTEPLGHGAEHARIGVLAIQRSRRAPQEGACRFQFSRHIGDAALQRLEFIELLAEGLSLFHVGQRLVERGLRAAKRASRDIEPAAIEAKGLNVNGGPAVVRFDGKNGLQVTKDEDDDPSPSGRNWAFALVWFVYNLVFLKKLGTTPGKRLLKLKVISMDGGPLDKKQRVMRSAVSLLSGYAGGLGYLWALFEPQRRGWHDLMADTRVVTAE